MKTDKEGDKRNEEKRMEEYPTITEIILGLEGLEEEKKYLAIGAGVFLGSKKAYERQNGRQGVSYLENRIVDQAEEAGMMGEEILCLIRMGEREWERTVSEIEKEESGRDLKRASERWTRPYFIIGTRRYDKEKLRELGEYLEGRMKGRKIGGINIGENRNKHLEYKRLIEELELVRREAEKGGYGEEPFREKVGIEIKRTKAKRLLEENSSLTRYLIEFYGRRRD